MNKEAPYSASQIANFFLLKAKSEKRSITMLKLVKLCYIAHGWYLALRDDDLIDENIEAWQYGPVVPSIYHEFKHFGRNPINALATEARFDGNDLQFETPEIPRQDQFTRNVLEKVWNVYKGMQPGALIDKTHLKNTPWSKYFKEGHQNTEIPSNAIRDHYKIILEKAVS